MSIQHLLAVERTAMISKARAGERLRKIAASTVGGGETTGGWVRSFTIFWKLPWSPFQG
ncbi:MAG TPA: hypothetical protein VFV05_10215 [Methylomirabilota bacterium]|nr:hypothetical protein [Methylomirabilota bacterium]